MSIIPIIIAIAGLSVLIIGIEREERIIAFEDKLLKRFKRR